MTDQSIIDAAFDAMRTATTETDKAAGRCKDFVGGLTAQQATASAARIQMATNMQIVVRNFLAAEAERIQALGNINLLRMQPGGHA